MPITQRQIALEANVSRSTVAAVMSKIQRDRISPEVRARVMAAAEKLGYRPNRHAQVMRGVRSNCIGIISFGGTESLVQRKLKVATEVILSHGFRFIVEEALWYQPLGAEALSRMVDNLIDARVEGVLLNYPGQTFTQELLDRLLKAGIPVVAIASGELNGIAQYVSDRPWGYYTLTRHLLEGGYRRLLLLASPRSDGYCGYHQALSECPEAEQQSQMILPEIPREAVSGVPIDARAYREGELAAEKALKLGELPEAVVCSNDEWAIGALAVLARAGIRVPEEIALTGFDNTPCSGFGMVPITTIDHPIRQISTDAVNHLIAQIRDGIAAEPQRIAIQGQLLVRSSCGLSARRSQRERS